VGAGDHQRLGDEEAGTRDPAVVIEDAHHRSPQIR
jgi:hypothetical protein